MEQLAAWAFPYRWYLLALLLGATMCAILWLSRHSRPGHPRVTLRQCCLLLAPTIPTNIAFNLYRDDLLRSGDAVALVALQLAKDGPGLIIIGFTTVVCAHRSLAFARAKARPWRSVLRSCPRVFLVGFLLAALIGVLGGVPDQLENGADLNAVLYRAAIFAPMTFYPLLVSYSLFHDARSLGALHRGTARMLAFFSLGALVWGLLAAIHLLRPSILAWLQLQPGGPLYRATDLAIAALWLVTAASWVLGFVVDRSHNHRANFGLAFTNSYRSRSTALAGLLADPGAPWRRSPGWRRTMTELARATHDTCRNRHDARTEARYAQTAYALLAFLADQTPAQRTVARQRLLALTLLHKRALIAIPDHAPNKTALRADPLPLACLCAFRLSDYHSSPTLIPEPTWVQLVAYLAAEAGLLAPAKSAAILNNHVSHDVTRALADVRFFLSRPLVPRASGQSPPHAERPTVT